jgi:homoserine O-acetyltransferase/O-succinyltransferase
MRMARKLGTITYRSHEEWDQRFGRRRVAETPGQPAISARSSKSSRTSNTRVSGSPTSFDANCYLYLSRAMDQFDLAEHGGGSLPAAFAKFRNLQRSLVLGAQTDMLYTIDQQRSSPTSLRNAGATSSSTRSRRPRGTTPSWSMAPGSSRRSATS